MVKDHSWVCRSLFFDQMSLFLQEYYEAYDSHCDLLIISSEANLTTVPLALTMSIFAASVI